MALLHSPAAARNIRPIADVLADWLPESGLVLEVASGSGEHALAFARRFPQLEWQPSDPDPAALASIVARRRAAGPANLLEPIRLDVTWREWPVRPADAMLAINMVHISPWNAALGLLDGSANVLRAGGVLILYGPWILARLPTAESNLAFDRSLRERNPEWGLRQVEEFEAGAVQRGFALEHVRPMPTNNLMLLFRMRP